MKRDVLHVVVPDGYEDVISTTAQVSLPFWDRLLLLLGFKLRIHVSHYCLRKPEDVRTQIHAEAGEWKPGMVYEMGTRHGQEAISASTINVFNTSGEE